MKSLGVAVATALLVLPATARAAEAWNCKGSPEVSGTWEVNDGKLWAPSQSVGRSNIRVVLPITNESPEIVMSLGELEAGTKLELVVIHKRLGTVNDLIIDLRSNHSEHKFGVCSAASPVEK